MKPFRLYMRALHRDLGYLVAGLTLIYALSGIILIYRNSSFMKAEVQNEKQLKAGMSAAELNGALKLKGFEVVSEEPNQIVFNTGSYDSQTGKVVYKTQEVIPPFDRFISLHKILSSKAVHWFMIAYGVILFFLAISAFWMFNPGTHYFRRGILFGAIGVVVAVILLFMV